MSILKQFALSKNWLLLGIICLMIQGPFHLMLLNLGVASLTSYFIAIPYGILGMYLVGRYKDKK